MRVALDTNRYRDLVDGKPAVVRFLQVVDTIQIPFVVLAELRAGFAVGQRGRANEAQLQRLMMKPGVSVLYANDGTTRVYSTLFSPAEKAGNSYSDQRSLDRCLGCSTQPQPVHARSTFFVAASARSSVRFAAPARSLLTRRLFEIGVVGDLGAHAFTMDDDAIDQVHFRAR